MGPQGVILISPSADSPSNNVLKTLKIDCENDLCAEYSEKILGDMVAVLVKDQEDVKQYRKYVKTCIQFEAINNVNGLTRR